MAAIQITSGMSHPGALLTGPAGALGLHRETFGLSAGEAEGLIRSILNGLHLPVFAVLAGVWGWTLPPWVERLRPRLSVALLVCVAFAVLNELSQLAVPQRLASVTDGVVDVLGVLLGLGVVGIAERALGRGSSSMAGDRST